MKTIILFALMIFGIGLTSHAQQRLEHGMNYIYNPKPNSILYNDTLFRGSRQFERLFYRDGDIRLINYYEKHQSNKIAGQVLGVLGTITSVVGISLVSSSGNNKGAAWAMVGGGFACSLMGGYLTLMGQRNLQLAVTLFNARHSKASGGLGVANRQAGLVFAF